MQATLKPFKIYKTKIYYNDKLLFVAQNLKYKDRKITLVKWIFVSFLKPDFEIQIWDVVHKSLPCMEETFLFSAIAAYLLSLFLFLLFPLCLLLPLAVSLFDGFAKPIFLCLSLLFHQSQIFLLLLPLFLLLFKLQREMECENNTQYFTVIYYISVHEICLMWEWQSWPVLGKYFSVHIHYTFTKLCSSFWKGKKKISLDCQVVKIPALPSRNWLIYSPQLCLYNKLSLRFE